MTESKQDRAERIVKAIERDFADRHTLKQGWERIDEEVKDEILDTWVKLVCEELPEPKDLSEQIRNDIEENLRLAGNGGGPDDKLSYMQVIEKQLDILERVRIPEKYMGKEGQTALTWDDAEAVAEEVKRIVQNFDPSICFQEYVRENVARAVYRKANNVEI